MEHYVYVQDVDGNPMMPTKRYGKVRRLLRDGKAIAVQTKPFTIRLTYTPETDVLQEVTVSEDPGRTNIGVSAIREDGKCLFRAKCTTRNKEIPKLMAERRVHRQASRRGERLARKRLAKRLGTTMKSVMERKLPGYGEGVVKVKHIINTEAKFNNRKRPEGWLTPTARQLLETHINLVKLVQRLLPITALAAEQNKFDFVRMENPKVKSWQYQHGPLYGYGTVKKAIIAIQEGKCLLCGEANVEHVHHMLPRSKDGSNTLKNLVGLCTSCHEKVHHDDKVAAKLSKKKQAFNKKYGALSVLNQIIGRFFQWATDTFDDVYAVQGRDTKEFRDDHGLPKDHDIDAYCIGMIPMTGVTVDDDMPPCYEILQFRDHDRARIKAQMYRTYKLDGEVVAKNRRAATEAKIATGGKVIESRQAFPALDDWFDHMVDLYGREEAERMRSRLTVEKSYRRYNNPDRILPGAVFYYKGKRYILQGQLTNGTYYRAIGQGNRNFPARECKIYRGRGVAVA